MTKLNGIYKCNICGNIVEVLHAGVGDPVCCNQTMELLKEKTTDIGKEKHVPVIEKTPDGIKVKVGAIPHPMEEKHFIEWIEIIDEGKVCRKFLKPGNDPSAEFGSKSDKIIVREYCSVHGLWQV